VPITQPGRLDDGAAIERIELERDAFTFERPRLLVEGDVGRVRDLLDEDDDL
jgi:hypothetical protein